MNINRRPATYNPYKRAIAMAIDLERTYDSIAGILGHSMPLQDRITSEPGRRPGKERLRLPRPLTLDVLNEMAARRMDAINELHGEIAPTLGNGECGLIDDLVAEMRERTRSQENHRSAPRGPSRQLDSEDRMSFDEIHLRDIERAADTPPSRINLAKNSISRSDAAVDHISFSIDLMMDGLLDHYRINRDALYKELAKNRDALSNRNSWISLTSPALRSNTAKPIQALAGFPPTLFRLRGLSLEIERLTMPIIASAIYDGEWTYVGASGERNSEAPRLIREDGMYGYDLFDMPRRALRDVLQDKRFHDAIVIDQTDRFGIDTGHPRTTIRLRRGYTHLDPPGRLRERLAVRRPFDVRETRQRFDEPHLIYAPIVDRILRELGQMQRHRLEPRAAGGVTLAIAEKNGVAFVHRYEIRADTIADGDEAIRARLGNIVTTLDNWERKHGRNSMHALTTPIRNETTAVVPVALETVDQDEETNATTEPAKKQDKKHKPSEMVAALWGDEIAKAYETSERIDDLLRDVLASDKIRNADAIELHQLEKMTCIKRMRIEKDMLYRLEKFERMAGRATYAVGTIEVERALTPGTIEALRDGNIGMLIKAWPNFGRSQVRRVSQSDGMVLITVRIPLSERK